MFKNRYFMTLNPFICIMISLLLFFPSIAIAQNKSQMDSVITLPIRADLSVLEEYLNDIVPNMLADINEPNKVCVESQYFKTKGIPKCRRDGFKISCKSQWIKIKTVPKIKCDVKGWVKRNGPISVSGQDKTLKFAFPIKAQVSTKVGINETANAAAILYIHATPSINKDWSVAVDIEPHFVWSEQPTVTLMEIIKVNVKNKVEPKLRSKLNAFVKEVPKLLADLNMQDKVHTAWQYIQEPLKIDNDSETYLLFKPQSASYSGFDIIDNVLQTTISAKGKTEIIVGKPSVGYKKTKLCKLGSIPCQEGTFNFNLPISITYQELLEMSNKKLLKKYSIVKISNPKIKKTSSGKISISAHISYDNRSKWLKMIDLFNWFDIDGEITFNGSPRINKDTRHLVIDNLIYDSTTNNDLFDVLVDAAELEPIQSYFSDLIKYEFGSKIDEGIIQANKALKTFSKDDLDLSASLEMASIEDIVLNEKHITINTKLSGTVDANISF